MVRARICDDGIPDHRFIDQLPRRGGGIRPVGGDIDENLLGVPGEEGGEVCGEREADVGVLFAFGGVVVGSAADAGEEGELSSW